jgi:DNA-directed RNA polymerase specialized sigma24 family protein
MAAQPRPPDNKNLLDEYLVKLIVQGDEAAFKEVHQRHWARMMRFAWGELVARGICGLEPEEIAETTFIVALTKLEAFDPKTEKLRTWLCEIAKDLI